MIIQYSFWWQRMFKPRPRTSRIRNHEADPRPRPEDTFHSNPGRPAAGQRGPFFGRPCGKAYATAATDANGIVKPDLRYTGTHLMVN